MTNLLGIPIDLITLIQLLTTVVLAAAFAVRLSLQEADADHKSESEILLLASFVTAHHPASRSIQDLTEAAAKEVRDDNCEIHYTVPRLKNLVEKGTLPSQESAASTSVLEHVFMIVGAPVISVLAFVDHIATERRYREHRIIHTALRENYVSKSILLIAIDLMFLAVGAQLVQKTWRVAGFLLCGAALCGVVAGFSWVLMLVRDQVRWKEFWDERLLEIMAASSQANNHDLFNRAHLFKTTVERQSDVPVTGGLAFYIGAYSVIQVAVAWILGRVTG